jgi:hypothetical protein
VGARLPGLSELVQLRDCGARNHAVLTARGGLLSEAFIDSAGEEEFQTALVDFYKAASPHALHTPALCRKAGIVRHALGHLIRGTDSFPRKIAHCLATDGPYYVAGLGPAFWSALVQGMDTLRNPAWTPVVPSVFILA